MANQKKRIDNINSSVKKQVTSFSDRIVSLFERAKMTEHLFMIIVAIIIGILAGFGAIAIRALISEISEISFSGEGSLLDNIRQAPWWVKIIVPTIGGLIVGPIIYKFAPEAKGHGVPEVMQSILLKGGKIRPRVAVVKAFASAVTIGTGGSVGREGPIIQIGSSLGSTVAQFFKMPSRRMKTMVGCGAAAGIAAAFNAPIAGALFAVEIILMDFAVAQFSPIVISSVMATVISHYFEGDFAAFQVPSYSMVSPFEIFNYFALGLLAGFISWLFIKVLYFSEDFWDLKVKVPEYMKASIGGILIGLVAIYYPEVMGVGYDSINMALNGQAVWHIAFALIFIKIIATSITLGSGGSGGIFAPSLFMGAMVGAFFGSVVNYLFPGSTANPGAYALVAMGGLVAGTTRAPITAIIIVFEMTQDYSIILPLMVTCIISTILSTKLSRESIYTLKLLMRNINIKENAEMNVMKSLKVDDVMDSNYQAIPENTKFDDVVKHLIGRRIPYVSVEDLNGKFMGIISLNMIKDSLFDKDMLRLICIAGDICDKHIVTVLPEDDCKSVIDKMSHCDYDGLPVMAPDDPDKQIGIIWRRDINDAYKKEMEYIELTSGLAEKITSTNSEQDIRFLEGYSMTEIPVPKNFVGKSIRGLNIRVEHGVEVLSIKSTTDVGRKVMAIPQADYVFQSDDLVVVAGRAEQVNILKNL